MLIRELLAQLPEARLERGTDSVEFSSVEIDSRIVSAGALFGCIDGGALDGHDFAGPAVSSGAVALLTEHDVDLDDSSVAEVRVPTGSARSAVALASALVLGRPADSLLMIGVTGTNGKTTVASLVGEILAAAGREVSVIGTLSGERTTPAPPELHRRLAELLDRARGASKKGAVSMEVSSHALDQGRVDGIFFDIAIFTNLSHDHLDYHGTLERYFEAKASLFSETSARIAVVWAETEEGRRIIAGRSAETIPVTMEMAEDLEIRSSGSRFVWRGEPISLSILGRNGVIDALLAAEAAAAAGVEPPVIAKALSSSAGVAGRMQVVAGPPGCPVVVVDYAHTPDALESALVEMRRIALDGRVTVVFGCGGDRDKAKRPMMGAVAARGADLVVVTSDNPRHEDAAEIAAQVVVASPGAVVELDRRTAIAAAIESSGPQDVVLIAGKGHELTQQMGDELRPFDDRAVAAQILEGRAAAC